MQQTNDDEQPEVDGDGVDLTMDDVIYWMGWHMDSQRRIYDVLLSLLAGMSDSQRAKDLQQMHAAGKFLYPPAYMHDAPERADDETQ